MRKKRLLVLATTALSIALLGFLSPDLGDFGTQADCAFSAYTFVWDPDEDPMPPETSCEIYMYATQNGYCSNPDVRSYSKWSVDGGNNWNGYTTYQSGKLPQELTVDVPGQSHLTQILFDSRVKCFNCGEWTGSGDDRLVLRDG